MGAGFGIDTSGWLHRDNDDMLAPEVAAFWSGKPRVTYYCRRITVILGIILQLGVIHASRGHLSSRLTRYPPKDEFANSSSGAYLLIRPSLALTLAGCPYDGSENSDVRALKKFYAVGPEHVGAHCKACIY